MALPRRAIGAHSVWAVAVRGVAPAGRETAHADGAAARDHLRHVDDPRRAVSVRTEQRAKDTANAGSIIQTALHRRGALLRGHLSVHAITAVTAIAVILRAGRGSRGQCRKARATGENFRDHTHDSDLLSKMTGASRVKRAAVCDAS